MEQNLDFHINFNYCWNKMRNIIYTFTFFIILALSLNAQYGKAIASLPFRGENITPQESEYLASMFASEFVSRGYTLVTRTSAFKETLAEMHFQKDISTANIAEFGKLVGADYVLVGNIDYVFGKMAMTAQVISVEKATILASATEDIRDISDINQDIAAKMVKKIVLDMSILIN